MYPCMSLLLVVVVVIDWIEFYILFQHGISHMRHPCDGHVVGPLCLLHLYSVTSAEISGAMGC